MSFDISSILGNITQGAVDAAKQVATNLVKEASSDALDFVRLAAPSIGRYVDLLAANQITVEEFKSLMMGLKDLAGMFALTQAGLVAIEVDKTRNSILKAVTGIAMNAIGKVI